MKLKKIAPQITKLARQSIGGFGMYVWIGQRESTLAADKDRDTRSINLEDFANHDDTDLFDTLDGWRSMDIAENAELDFYVYDRDELKDNLGILIRGGVIVAWRVTGDSIRGDDTLLWRPINGGAMQPKAFFAKVSA